MAFKRSAVRSRLSPPSENTEEKSPVFLFCTVHGRTADLLQLNPGQRNPLRAAAERPEPSAVRSRLSPPNENTEEESPVFLFCTVHGRTADLLQLNPGQRNPLRAAAERPEPSAVRSRLSPPNENTEEESPVFLFCTVHGRTADLLRLNPSQRNPLRAAAERPEPSVVRTRLSPKSELSRTPCGFGTVLVLLWAEKRPDF